MPSPQVYQDLLEFLATRSRACWEKLQGPQGNLQCPAGYMLLILHIELSWCKILHKYNQHTSWVHLKCMKRFVIICDDLSCCATSITILHVAFCMYSVVTYLCKTLLFVYYQELITTGCLRWSKSHTVPCDVIYDVQGMLPLKYNWLPTPKIHTWRYPSECQRNNYDVLINTSG